MFALVLLNFIYNSKLHVCYHSAEKENIKDLEENKENRQLRGEDGMSKYAFGLNRQIC